jgi:CRISPR-associated exonuclease Cas4
MSFKRIIDVGTQEVEKDKRTLHNKGTEGGRDYFYASDCFKCKRSLFFEFTKRSVLPVDSALLRVFHNGDKVHERLHSYIEKFGSCQCEVDMPFLFFGGVPVHGRCDDLVEVSGVRTVVDYKSINCRVVACPKREHIAQLMLYLYAFDLPFGFLVYESKQTQDIFEFKVAFDERSFGEVREYFEDVAEFLKADRVPDAGGDGRHYPCFWGRGGCSFREFCW